MFKNDKAGRTCRVSWYLVASGLLSIIMFSTYPSSHQRASVPASLLAEPAFAQWEAQEPEAFNALGTISGTVTDEDGNPIEGIVVTAYYETVWYQSTQGSTVTDITGQYQVGGLPFGEYFLSFRDREGAFLTKVLFDEHGRFGLDGMIIIAGNHVTDIDTSLEMGGQIAGKFDFEDRDSVSYAHIEVYESQTQYSTIANFNIDPFDEMYETPALPPGEYIICATIYVYAGTGDSEVRDCFGSTTTLQADAVPVAVTKGETTLNVDLFPGSPSKFGQISGQVRDKDGTQLENIRVSLNRTDSEYPLVARTTNETGEYYFPYLAPAEYEVSFHDLGDEYLSAQFTDEQGLSSIQVMSGVNIENIDTTLERGGKITGTVFRDGVPVAEQVSIRALTVADSSSDAVSYAWTDPATGTFELTKLPPGAYIVEADYYYSYYRDSIIGYHGGALEAEAIPVEVETAETVSDADVLLTTPILPLNGVLEGQVTANGEPLGGIRVNLHTTNPAYPAPLYYTETDANGQYRIPGLGDIVRRLSFVDLSGVYATLFHSDQVGHSNANSVRLSDSETVTINADLPIAGSLSGNVLTSENSPNTEVYINVWRADDSGTLSLVTTAQPDQGGSYRIKHLVPGDYVLKFLAPTGSQYNQRHEVVQQLFAQVLPGEVTSVQDAITGVGIPLSLELIVEPTHAPSIYIPFSAY